MRKRRKAIRTENKIPRTGEIWFCQLPEVGGSVQKGERPVLVVSNNLNNRYSTTVNIIPMTSKEKADFPAHVYISEPEKCGLPWPSTILAEQITTIPKEWLGNRVGELDEHMMRKVGEAISIQIPAFSLEVQ